MIKKIILILFASSMIYAQSLTVTHRSVDFNADSVSQTLTIDKGSFLKGIYVPQGLTDTLDFQVSPDGTTFYSLANTDSTVYRVAMDSSQTNAIPLPEDIFKGFKYIKFITCYDRADTTSINSMLINR